MKNILWPIMEHKHFMAVLLLIALLAARAITGGLPMSFAQEELQSPRYQEGEFWQFELRDKNSYEEYESTRLASGVYEIVHSQNQFRSFYVGPKGKEELIGLPPSLMLLVGHGQDFSFPLRIGKKWSYQWVERFRNPECFCNRFYWHTAEVNVAGIESVTTQAGTFNAFKLVKTEGRTTTGPRQVTTYYFSPESQSVIRMQGEPNNEIVLIQHGIGSGIPATVSSSHR